jgi:hypothetical protein
VLLDLNLLILKLKDVFHVLRNYACIIDMAFILLSDALMHIRPSLKHARLLVYFFV